MSDLLQTIQNTVANESTPSFADFKWSDLTAKGNNNLWPEVCKRYAFEVAKASLKEASEKIMEQYEYQSCSTQVKIITDESNIKL